MSKRDQAAHRRAAALAGEYALLLGLQGPDNCPLVCIMALLAEEIGIGRLGRNPQARRGWQETLRLLQDDRANAHNHFLPCRTCHRTFEPVVDDNLLTLFLKWYDSPSPEDRLDVHRCPGCGGQVAASRTRRQ